MITKHLQVCKSILLLAFAISLFLFSNCSSFDPAIPEVEVTVTDAATLEFDKEGGSKTIKLKSNSEWKVVKKTDAHWIKVSPANGIEGDVVLTVNVENNEGEAREGVFTIIASESEKTITIKQEGADELIFDYVTIKEIRTMYAESEKQEWKIAKPMMLKGVVISDRTCGNRPSQRDGYIQDDAGDGLAFRVNQSIHSFDMGDKLSINLEGAIVLYYGGILQLNFSNKEVELQAQNMQIAPKEFSIEELLEGMYDGTLVKIKDVQFKEYIDLNYWEKGIATNRTLENENDATITVKTTKYASFKDDALPAGKGSIVGIMSFCNDDWQLVIRNLDDVKEMSTDAATRFTLKEPPVEATKISVADFKSALKEGEIYTKDNFIEVEVLLNAYQGNVPDNTVYIADGTAGITLLFSDKENILTHVPIGAKVKVSVKNVVAKELNGMLHIGVDNSLSTQAVEIVEKKVSSPLQPKVATMDEIVAGKYQSELVRIENVQFKNVKNRYGDSPFIINEALKEVEVYTRGNATFANDIVKEGMGSMVTVVSMHNSPQMLIRSIDDLADMTGERFGAIPSFISSDKSSIDFKSKGGDAIINISANVDWTAKSDQSWLTINPNDGNNNGTITATANKNEGKERKATITITNGTITTTVQVMQECVEESGSIASDLFFSEYVEGSSYNKYLEIYNGTGKIVDLSDYKVNIYINGQSTAKYTELLSGKLENGAVLVLQNTKSTLYEGVTSQSTAINFNGNDAIALVKISTDTFVDIFGTIGEDPGKAWTTTIFESNLTTIDRTLVRKPSIRGGITKNPDDGFPALQSEWIMYPIDTIDYLGSHTMN